jgi:D-alanyl-D-alanine carboxypeptidase
MKISKWAVFLLTGVFLAVARKLNKLPSNLIRIPPKKSRYQKLPAQIDSLTDAPEFQPDSLALYRRNGFRSSDIRSQPTGLFMPASNMKLFTTTTAMALLDSNFYFKTSLYHDGYIRNDTLYGNLIVKGSGDPTISGRFYQDDILTVFKEWITALDSLHIHYINGKIIGDDNIMDDCGLGYGWSWDDLSYYYAAPTSGLTFNDNCLDFECWPAVNVGEKATSRSIRRLLMSFNQ